MRQVVRNSRVSAAREVRDCEKVTAHRGNSRRRLT
jgi:hypothetical protein